MIQGCLSGLEIEDAVEQIAYSQEQAVEPIRAEIQAIKDRKRKVREMNAERPSEDSDYWVLVVFRSRKEKEAWLERAGYPLDLVWLSHEEYAAKTQASGGDASPAVCGSAAGAPAGD